MSTPHDHSHRPAGHDHTAHEPLSDANGGHPGIIGRP